LNWSPFAQLLIWQQAKPLARVDTAENRLNHMREPNKETIYRCEQLKNRGPDAAPISAPVYIFQTRGWLAFVTGGRYALICLAIIVLCFVTYFLTHQ
jgi:hypothetical protein